MKVIPAGVFSYWIGAENKNKIFLFPDSILRGDIYPKPPTTLTYFAPDYPLNHRLSSLQHQLHISTAPFDQTTSTGPWSNLIIPYHGQPIPDGVVATSEDKNGDEEVKKRNPYSIEELLKKPESKRSRRAMEMEFSGVRQPVGMLVKNEEVVVEKVEEL